MCRKMRSPRGHVAIIVGIIPQGSVYFFFLLPREPRNFSSRTVRVSVGVHEFTSLIRKEGSDFTCLRVVLFYVITFHVRTFFSLFSERNIDICSVSP
jgi:hypothetical protein